MTMIEQRSFGSVARVRRDSPDESLFAPPLPLKLCPRNSRLSIGADQSYTMALNGVVDAAVNGGLANYVSFLDGTYRELNPEIAEDIDANPNKADVAKTLVLLERQLDIMDHGITVHSPKGREAMKPLSEHTEGNYRKMKADAGFCNAAEESEPELVREMKAQEQNEDESKTRDN